MLPVVEGTRLVIRTGGWPAEMEMQTWSRRQFLTDFPHLQDSSNKFTQLQKFVHCCLICCTIIFSLIVASYAHFQ